MRRITTGVDARGRSCIVDDVDVPSVAYPEVAGLRSGTLWTGRVSPPEAAPWQSGTTLDVQLPPGVARWFVVENDPPLDGSPPDIRTTLHHQESLELVYVVEGGFRLVLDEDQADLVAGDAVVLPGVDHAFITASEGSRLLAVTIGLAAPG